MKTEPAEDEGRRFSFLGRVSRATIFKCYLVYQIVSWVACFAYVIHTSPELVDVLREFAAPIAAAVAALAGLCCCYRAARRGGWMLQKADGGLTHEEL